MQVCANELKAIMKNVLDKRKHTEVIIRSSLTPPMGNVLHNHTLFHRQ